MSGTVLHKWSGCALVCCVQAFGLTLEDVALYDMSSDFVVVSERAEMERRNRLQVAVRVAAQMHYTNSFFRCAPVVGVSTVCAAAVLGCRVCRGQREAPGPST